MCVVFLGWSTSWNAGRCRDEETDGATRRQQRSRHDGNCSTNVRCWNCRVLDLHVVKGTKRFYALYFQISALASCSYSLQGLFSSLPITAINPFGVLCSLLTDVRKPRQLSFLGIEILL